MHGVTMERVAQCHKGDEVGKPRREVPMTEEQKAKRKKWRKGAVCLSVLSVTGGTVRAKGVC